MLAGPMRIDYANRLIDAFASGGQGIGFARISRADVVSGLRVRVNDPEKQNQLHANLCGPAAFLYSLLNDKPEIYTQYVIDLYNTGRARLGSMTIAPSSGCRAFKPDPSDIAAVDWIALGSLRDSENSLLDYDSVTGTLSAMTTPRTLSHWFHNVGYGGVRNDTNVVFHKGRKEIEECARDFDLSRSVCLLINANMLSDLTVSDNSHHPDHWVVLEERPNIVGDRISLRLYSWGLPYVVPTFGKISIDTFRGNFYGYVSASPRFN